MFSYTYSQQGSTGQHFFLSIFRRQLQGTTASHRLGARIVANPDTVSQPALWLVKHSDNVSGDSQLRTRRQSPGGGWGNFPDPDVLLRWSSRLYGNVIRQLGVSKRFPRPKPTSGDLSGQPAHPFVRVADHSGAVPRNPPKITQSVVLILSIWSCPNASRSRRRMSPGSGP